MKKFFVTSLAMLLVLGSLSGCFLVKVDEPVTDILKPQNEPAQKLPENEPVIEALSTEPTLQVLEPAMDMSDPISELYALELTDYSGYSASYHVPQINCDSPDAQRINDDIAERYSRIVEEEQQNQEDGVSLTCEYIEWRTVPSGEYTFSLIVSCAYPGGNVYYTVYNFDGMSGREITNEDILSHFELTEDKFLELARDAAESFFVGHYGSMAEMDPDYYQNRLEFTVSDEQIHTGLPMFINEKGGLSIIAEIGSLAGAGAYSRIIEIYG